MTHDLRSVCGGSGIRFKNQLMCSCNVAYEFGFVCCEFSDDTCSVTMEVFQRQYFVVHAMVLCRRRLCMVATMSCCFSKRRTVDMCCAIRQWLCNEGEGCVFFAYLLEEEGSMWQLLVGQIWDWGLWHVSSLNWSYLKVWRTVTFDNSWLGRLWELGWVFLVVMLYTSVG